MLCRLICRTARRANVLDHDINTGMTIIPQDRLRLHVRPAADALPLDLQDSTRGNATDEDVSAGLTIVRQDRLRLDLTPAADALPLDLQDSKEGQCNRP